MFIFISHLYILYLYCNNKKKMSDLFPIIFNIICYFFVFLFTLFVVAKKIIWNVLLCLLYFLYWTELSRLWDLYSILSLSMFLVISRTFLIDLIPELCVYWDNDGREQVRLIIKVTGTCCILHRILIETCLRPT